MSHETDCIAGIIHHISVSCGNGRFEIVFFKSVGIYYRIEKLFIINIEREIRNNEIVVDVRILFFEFIDTATA